MSPAIVSYDAASAPQCQTDDFVAMLPTIGTIARRAFRAWNYSDREELVAEAIASSFVQYCGLLARGAADRAFATPLGHYGVRHAHVGRRVGGHLNRDDVSSAYCRRHRKVSLLRLTLPSSSNQSTWKELVVEDRRASPAEVAAVRVDFQQWLDQLPEREHRIALYLASGEPTCNAAAHFGVSSGRLSQIRAELRASWEAFQADDHGDRAPNGRLRPAARPADRARGYQSLA